MTGNRIVLALVFIIAGIVFWISNSLGYLKIYMGDGTYFLLGNTLALIFLVMAILILIQMLRHSRSPDARNP